MEKIFKVVGTDTLLKIFLFLSSVELSRFSRLSKSLPQLQDEAINLAWKAFSLQRWNLPLNIQRKFSRMAAKELFRYLLERNQVPFGKYTTNHLVFGIGKSSELAGWLFLNHSSDGLLQVDVGSQLRTADLRICVQNLSTKEVEFNLENSKFTTIHTISSEEIKDGLLSHLNCYILSKNGHFMDSGRTQQNLKLKYLEFAVISLKIRSPESVKSEPDFLSVLTHIQLRAADEQSADIKPVGEDRIWSSYQALPRGIYILKDQNDTF
jgi:hypothetical protein